MLRASAFVFKGRFAVVLMLLALGPCLCATDAPKSNVPKPGDPTDPKARKTYDDAEEWQQHRDYGQAMDEFRKANRQDGGHCAECLHRAYGLAMKIGAFKDAEEIAREMLPQAVTGAEKASAHYLMARALLGKGISIKKDKFFSESCDELRSALTAEPALAEAHYALGVSLAYLHQDDAARQEFAAFLGQDRRNPDEHERAKRYMERIELARATMAPPFSLTALDGQRVSMDGLAGKVVLIDFWATWCGPCREALPHMRQIAKKFDGQPFVVLSISLDSDDGKWREFVAKNGMTWMQYRNGGSGGDIAKQFGVNAIPATFTMDADGVLEDQHVGDADIERKIKKLIARAVEMASRKPAPVAAEKSAGDAE
jgi:thiol-disulfide isomerase/thioredoxin